ncbi:EAL domain-containing protein [Photobacterium leiognathi]|uniref:EAL domain-containing protein n=1 Tax=Photobacterium leiognathi TaxID=553611 RepID=UPI002982ABCB|nr:EAL domain-containing protein [Photobacterium leiognathi]
MNIKSIKPISITLSSLIGFGVLGVIFTFMYYNFINTFLIEERQISLEELRVIEEKEIAFKKQFSTLAIPNKSQQTALTKVVAKHKSISSIAVIHDGYFVYSTYGIRDRKVEKTLEPGFYVKPKSALTKKPIIYYQLQLSDKTYIRIYFKPLTLDVIDRIGDGYIDFGSIILATDNKVIKNNIRSINNQFNPETITLNIDVNHLAAIKVFMIHKLGYIITIVIILLISCYLLSKKIKQEFIKYQIRHHRIKPYLQPIIDRDGHIIGAEILARWITNKGELVAPYLFIPYIEQEKLTPLLTCSLLAQIHNSNVLNNAKAFKLSFNLTELCLFEPKVYALSKRLAQHCRLVLEFTESTPFIRKDTPEKMLVYRQHGVEFAIDDYGTGFSAPHYLTEYKFDYLKIDKCFIDNLDDNKEKSTHLIESIVFLAKKLNLELVAEGVETDIQKNILKTLGIRYFQGFLFYKPMDLKAFSQLIAKSDKP